MGRHTVLKTIEETMQERLLGPNKCIVVWREIKKKETAISG